MNWHPASWQSRPATQQPKYADPAALERAVAALSRLPPLVVSWEVEALRAKLAQAQRGEQFLLQGGDCAESFEDCESDNIAKRLKILLQMSLVLLQGLKKPIIRVGRFRRPVRQAALGGHRDSGGRDVAVLSRRQRQSAGLQRRRARTGPRTLVARLRARVADFELRARADRRRFCRSASSRILGSGLSCATRRCAMRIRRSSTPSPSRWSFSNR